MPETPTDHISITSGAVEDLETFKLRRQAARIVPQLLDPLTGQKLDTYVAEQMQS